MKNNILIIAAHPDDEILGVGGTILKHIQSNDKVNILILGDGETSRGADADIVKRTKQAQKAAKFLGAQQLFLEKLPDNKFDSIPLLDIIKAIEKYIQKIKPNIVYTHYSNDLNIDHRLTFQATITACRPQPNFFVKSILTFETLSSTEWQDKTGAQIFCPSIYNNITEFMNKKIKILGIYQDEIKKFPHTRSVEGVKILARYRGMESGYQFAEAFQIIRLLND